MEIFKIIQYTGHRSAIYSMVDIPDKNYFVSAGGDGWIVAWKKDGSEPDGQLLAKTEGKIFCLAYCNSHGILLAGDMEGHLYFIDIDNHTTLKRLVIHKGSIFDIIIEGDTAFTCSADGYICRIDMKSMMPQVSVQISLRGLRCLFLHQNHLFIGGSDNSIKKLNLQTLECIENITDAHQNSVFTLCIDEEGKLYSGGRDAMLKQWTINPITETESLPGHWFTINKIVLFKQKYLLTASRDKTFRIWEKESLSLLKSVDFAKDGHINSVNSALFLKDSDLIATCSDDRSIILWKISE